MGRIDMPIKGNDWNEFDDPEECYRRGYSHGAWAVIDWIAAIGRAPRYEELRAWYRRVRRWRLKGYGKASPRLGNPPPSPPPVDRNSMFSMSLNPIHKWIRL